MTVAVLDSFAGRSVCYQPSQTQAIGNSATEKSRLTLYIHVATKGRHSFYFEKDEISVIYRYLLKSSTNETREKNRKHTLKPENSRVPRETGSRTAALLAVRDSKRADTYPLLIISFAFLFSPSLQTLFLFFLTIIFSFSVPGK